MYKTKKKPDYLLLVLVFLLVVIGLIFLSGVSIVIARNNGLTDYYYLTHQFTIGILGGVLGMIFIINVPYGKLKKIALPFMLVCIVLLTLVAFTPLGTSSGTTAQRWLNLGLFQFQPAELAKLAFIIYIAAWLDQRGKVIRSFSQGIVPFSILTGVVCFLVLMQPNASTMGLILIISMITLFTAGARFTHMAILFLIVISIGYFTMTSAEYRLNRIKVFLDPSADNQGIGYQINQAKIAIGTGGLTGVGLGQSKQKYNYLPETLGDSIFAIIAEETGLLGVSSILFIFILIGYRGIKIANEAEDKFGSSLAIGITSWIILQAFINIGAISGLFPLTGIPLPFISYGSSAMLITLFSVGILFSVSKGN